MADGMYVHIRGHNIYTNLTMPEVPRKGDVLWLGSLTRGAVDVPEAVVSKVEWSMDQQSGVISAWLTVRRINVKGVRAAGGSER